MVDPLHLDIGRNAGHFELVDLGKFAGLGHRGAGHAGKLVIEPEIVLEGHRGDRLVLRLDFKAFTRLDGLMQPLGEPPPLHCPAGEFINDHHLAILDHVMGVTLEQHMRPQRLVHMVQQPDILDIIKGALAHHTNAAKKLLGMHDAVLGQGHGAALFVEVVIVRHKIGNDLVGGVVLVRACFRLAGNDQRRTRLVDQD